MGRDGKNSRDPIGHPKPWHPLPTAPNCPLPLAKKFLEGKGLSQRDKFKGRKTELQSLAEVIDNYKSGKNIISATGIGGIGKEYNLPSVKSFC
jgi:hypothetical protein